MSGENFKLSNDETILVTWEDKKFYIYYLDSNHLTKSSVDYKFSSISYQIEDIDLTDDNNDLALIDYEYIYLYKIDKPDH